MSRTKAALATALIAVLGIVLTYSAHGRDAWLFVIRFLSTFGVVYVIYTMRRKSKS